MRPISRNEILLQYCIGVGDTNIKADSTICYHRAGYRCYQLYAHFMDAFLTYKGADVFGFLAVFMDLRLLFK